LHALAQNFARAAESFEEALRIRTEIGDQRGEMEALRQLGSVEALAGRIEQGVGRLNQALKMARSVLEDKASAAAILSDLGRAYIAMGDIRRANDVSLQALELSQQPGGQAYVGRALTNLGMTTLRLGDHDGAERYLTKALALAQGGERGDEARILTELGRNHLMTGRHQEAAALLARALTLTQQLKDSRLEEEIAALTSELHGRVSEHAEASPFTGKTNTSPAA
jgi:tetratricopeptide (TPR) repeat protein